VEYALTKAASTQSPAKLIATDGAAARLPDRKIVLATNGQDTCVALVPNPLTGTQIRIVTGVTRPMRFLDVSEKQYGG